MYFISKSTKIVMHFCASCIRFRDKNVSYFFTFYLQKLGHGHVVVSMMPFDSKYQNLQKLPMHFCASSNRFGEISIVNVLPSKSRSKSKNTILAMTPFDGKCQNLQSLSLHFFFTKIWPVQSIVTKRRMDTHTETDKAMVIRKIENLSKKWIQKPKLKISNKIVDNRRNEGTSEIAAFVNIAF